MIIAILVVQDNDGMQYPFHELEHTIKGDLHLDELHRIVYATDASVYRELPLGVLLPRDSEDIRKTVDFCRKHHIPIIPRATGTSLAGQCVGDGLILDISKYMNQILEINTEEAYVVVQPGVIRDDLNRALAPHGYFFGPNTSTANRATIGGMLGNNSCGSTSIVYGDTRQHVKDVEVVLSDGSLHTFSEISYPRREKHASPVESIYKKIDTLYNDKEIKELVYKEYPRESITRRNTGYALDELFRAMDNGSINLSKLLAGSEGTLAITTKIKIHIDPLPPSHEALLCVHFEDVLDSLKAVPLVMDLQPYACELMDKTVLDCTKGQRMYEKDRFFLEGDPGGVLMISYREDSVDKAKEKLHKLVEILDKHKLGYAYPIITDSVANVWNLRKAGLGLLANIPGDKKAVACIEDTAVDIRDLYDYIRDITYIMAKYNQEAVYYAHAGAGELHLRPILDLKKAADRLDFRQISHDTAVLVKKYNGSLSGEHGDGRVRAPFLPIMLGERLCTILEDLKYTFDPEGIYNPGKIIKAKDILDDLRYEEDMETPMYDTMYSFDKVGGLLRAAEKCNGSGDCRKAPEAGGTMCPSYQATRDEKSTTRARANTLREILTQKSDPFKEESLSEVMDLCLSCKGCTSECPSNVNMTVLKSEVMYQKYKSDGMPLMKKLMSRMPQALRLAHKLPFVPVRLANTSWIQSIMKGRMGIHPKRQLPTLARKPLSNLVQQIKRNEARKVLVFIDEFTNYYDVEVGQKALKLLDRLGYSIELYSEKESGRSAFSLGDLEYARTCAEFNLDKLSSRVSEEMPLIGLEPSTILSFRDEYPLIVRGARKGDAEVLAKHTFTIEEFLYTEYRNGHIDINQFKRGRVEVHLHGHCHQKALTDVKKAAWLLSIPSGSEVSIIPSGCCGMAGSFGYDRDKYDVSMKIGELVLFPYVRSLSEDAIVVASGTSCRHQIHDGTGRNAIHAVEFLYDMLLSE